MCPAIWPRGSAPGRSRRGRTWRRGDGDASREAAMTITRRTARRHMFDVGLLVTQLQVLEYSAREAVAKAKDPSFDVEYLRTIQPGSVVPEDSMTDYAQLRRVLARLNECAPPNRQVNIEAIVNLRDQLAHGRLTAVPKPGSSSPFPLTLLKFDEP